MPIVVIVTSVTTAAWVLTLPPNECFAIVRAAVVFVRPCHYKRGSYILMFPTMRKTNNVRPASLCAYKYRRLKTGKNCRGRRMPAAVLVSLI
jgi:hypothetical protein